VLTRRISRLPVFARPKLFLLVLVGIALSLAPPTFAAGQQAKLTPTVADAGFGYTVPLDGDTVVVGSSNASA
jgi:hypothetical protein